MNLQNLLKNKKVKYFFNILLILTVLFSFITVILISTLLNGAVQVEVIIILMASIILLLFNLVLSRFVKNKKILLIINLVLCVFLIGSSIALFVNLQKFKVVEGFAVALDTYNSNQLYQMQSDALVNANNLAAKASLAQKAMVESESAFNFSNSLYNNQKIYVDSQTSKNLPVSQLEMNQLSVFLNDKGIRYEDYQKKTEDYNLADKAAKSAMDEANTLKILADKQSAIEITQVQILRQNAAALAAQAAAAKAAQEAAAAQATQDAAIKAAQEAQAKAEVASATAQAAQNLSLQEAKDAKLASDKADLAAQEANAKAAASKEAESNALAAQKEAEQQAEQIKTTAAKQVEELQSQLNTITNERNTAQANYALASASSAENLAKLEGNQLKNSQVKMKALQGFSYITAITSITSGIIIALTNLLMFIGKH